MLTHTSMLEYGRARWADTLKNDKDAMTHVETHFFASTQRSLERDNVASRLWWMGHLCARAEGLSMKEGLDVFCIGRMYGKYCRTAYNWSKYTRVLRYTAQAGKIICGKQEAL